VVGHWAILRSHRPNTATSEARINPGPPLDASSPAGLTRARSFVPGAVQAKLDASRPSGWTRSEPTHRFRRNTARQPTRAGPGRKDWPNHSEPGIRRPLRRGWPGTTGNRAATARHPAVGKCNCLRSLGFGDAQGFQRDSPAGLTVARSLRSSPAHGKLKQRMAALARA